MFVVLRIFCYEETCSFLAYFTKDVPISSIPFCLPVCARHMQGVPTALLQKILPRLRDTEEMSLDLNCLRKKNEPDTQPPIQRTQLCPHGQYGYSMWTLGCPDTSKESLLCVDQLLQMEIDTDSNWKFSQPKSCIVHLRRNSQKVPAQSIYHHKIKSPKLWKQQYSWSAYGMEAIEVSNQEKVVLRTYSSA